MNKIYAILFVIGGLFPSTTTLWAQESKVDSLAYYTQLALEQNPGLQAQRLAYEAFLDKIPQAGAFDDPELSMGFYTKPMDIVGGRQIGDLTLMQMLPWFGTKKSAKKEAHHMASMQLQQYREAREMVILQVHTQWYVLQKLQQQVHNAQQNKALLEQLEQLAIQKFSAPSGATASNSMTISAPSTTTNTSSSGMGGMAMGGGSTANTATSSPTPSSSAMSGMSSGGNGSGMSDVLRIRLETIEIENTIESLQAQIKAEKAKFNALLDQEIQTAVTVPQTIDKVPFFLTDEEAQTMIETNNPMLAMLTEEGLAYQAKAEMDKKMSYPMLGLGVQYMIIGKTNDPMLAMGDMNGKDMIMPMVTLSLPIFRKKYKAQQEEGKKWWKSSEEKYKDTYNTLVASYYSFKNQVEDAERTITLLDKQSTLAETTFNLIVKEFVTGKSDLTNVIQVQRQLLDYQLKKAEAIANYNTLVASIENITATPNDL
ncbi:MULTISPECIES: TolC family protein [unclassified Myroides]|uniref:TolC family protein n=1 Tax=unclassified Myroides TaxID=2642485 RepID=UPI003D2F68B1